jgi:hypothetical protein
MKNREIWIRLREILLELMLFTLPEHGKRPWMVRAEALRGEHGKWSKWIPDPPHSRSTAVNITLDRASQSSKSNH